MTSALTRFELNGLEHVRSGKVREIYDCGPNLLLVASDRISAFDVVFEQGIPHKGCVLAQLAAFWFGQMADITGNHLITAKLDEMPSEVRSCPGLDGRASLCRKAKVLPVECVVRGHLEGSAWKEYRENGTVCSIRLPEGLKRYSRLPQPIFTPATKAELGEHDENIDFEQCVDIIGDQRGGQVRDLSLQLYQAACRYLEPRGIILADTKFEFGLIDDELIVVDEMLTPDSSRFWVRGSVESSGEPVSFDKQYVRNYLETLDWDKMPPAPELPDEVILRTSQLYLDIFEKITGHPPGWLS
jgi:phosphoribosylaminoimidazole-succinocarboxamide synthase